MNLDTARAIVRDAALNAGDQNAYSDTSVDLAIQALCDDFLLRTRQMRKLSTMTIGAGNAFLPVLPGAFVPARAIFASIRLAYATATITVGGNTNDGQTLTVTIAGYSANYITLGNSLNGYADGVTNAVNTSAAMAQIVSATTANEVVTLTARRAGSVGNGVPIAATNTTDTDPTLTVSSTTLTGGTDPEVPEVQIISPEAMTAMRTADRTSSQGSPRYIAFDTFTTGVVYPTPDVACTLNLTWIPPMDAITPGTNTPSTVGLIVQNTYIPDDWLRPALRFGGAGFLQGANPVYTYGSSAMARYAEWVNLIRGQTADGSRSIQRKSVSDLCRERGE